MPDFGEPDADWTDVYDWSRYRGPKPYPCPGAWVLGVVEGDGVGWHYYPTCNGDAYETQTELMDAVGHETWDGAQEAKAILLNDIVEDSRSGPTILKHTLSIGGTTVFERVEPDQDDLFGSVAEALARYDAGEGINEFVADVEPTTGRPTEGVQSERELERREIENRSLEAFSDG